MIAFCKTAAHARARDASLNAYHGNVFTDRAGSAPTKNESVRGPEEGRAVGHAISPKIRTIIVRRMPA